MKAAMPQTIWVTGCSAGTWQDGPPGPPSAPRLTNLLLGRPGGRGGRGAQLRLVPRADAGGCSSDDARGVLETESAVVGNGEGKAENVAASLCPVQRRAHRLAVAADIVVQRTIMSHRRREHGRHGDDAQRCGQVR